MYVVLNFRSKVLKGKKVHFESQAQNNGNVVMF